MNQERPRISHEAISVLLPCYNQAAGLGGIVESWVRALTKLEAASELIVIDDGSTDGTGDVATGLGSRRVPVKLLRHDERRGYGAALRTGLAAAQHPLVLTTACDYPYQPSDAKKLLDLIDSADVVSGCRTDPMPAFLRTAGRFYRLAVRVLFGLSLEPRPGWNGWGAWRRSVRDRWVFGLRLYDPASEFRLYRKAVLERIPIQSDSRFVHTEVLAKANFLGCVIGEAPIGRLGGTFRGVPEPPIATASADARRVFRTPRFVPTV